MKNILVTGFTPFGGEKINPSNELLQVLLGQCDDLDVLTLPVSFLRGWQVLREHLETRSYAWVIQLGQAAGRPEVCLERQAVNFKQNDQADEDGVRFSGEPIVATGPGVIFSPCPVDQWQLEARVLGLPLAVSDSAGLFVCNTVYYQSLLSSKESTKFLFVHLPLLPEQLQGKPSTTPSLSLDRMTQTLLFILNQCRALGAIK